MWCVGFVHSSSNPYWIRRRRKDPFWDMTLHHVDVLFVEGKTTVCLKTSGQIPSDASYPSRMDFSSTQLQKTIVLE
jgi:hypothetical protein